MFLSCGLKSTLQKVRGWYFAPVEPLKIYTRPPLSPLAKGRNRTTDSPKDLSRRRFLGLSATAAVSIMSNIAEGFESRTEVLFIEFLGRAKGSSGELRAQAYVAHDAGYLTQEQLKGMQDQCEKCSSQISRLMEYLKRTNKR